MKKDQAD